MSGTFNISNVPLAQLKQSTSQLAHRWSTDASFSPLSLLADDLFSLEDDAGLFGFSSTIFFSAPCLVRHTLPMAHWHLLLLEYGT